MIEIISQPVSMPEKNRRYLLDAPENGNLNGKWVVVDTDFNAVRYRGKYEDAAIACHNLNKAHYMQPTQH